jgi:hypothetical protein
MKSKILYLIFFIVVIAFLPDRVHAQDSKDSALQKIIETKHYIFKAQSALPQRGGLRNLTSSYDMQVIGDSIVTYLPYFGRAYVAPVDPTEGGIKFTSTNFSYTAKQKKDGWEITILPKDTRDVKQMYLSVSTKGYAKLQVISNNRESISYNGYVDQLK